jgi:hypothetical protein
MDLRRMRLDFDANGDCVQVFHTTNDSGDDPETIVFLNGKETEGRICYSKITDDEFLIRVIARPCHF